MPSGVCSAGFHSLYIAFVLCLLADFGFQLYAWVERISRFMRALLTLCRSYFMAWRFMKRLEHYMALATSEASEWWFYCGDRRKKCTDLWFLYRGLPLLVTLLRPPFSPHFTAVSVLSWKWRYSTALRLPLIVKQPLHIWLFESRVAMTPQIGTCFWPIVRFAERRTRIRGDLRLKHESSAPNQAKREQTAKDEFYLR